MRFLNMHVEEKEGPDYQGACYILHLLAAMTGLELSDTQDLDLLFE